MHVVLRQELHLMSILDLYSSVLMRKLKVTVDCFNSSLRFLVVIFVLSFSHEQVAETMLVYMVMFLLFLASTYAFYIAGEL